MADLQVDSIASTGGSLETLTNEVVKRSGPVIAQGTATFTNANNNINLAGLGVHPEVGDVLLISGSTNNNGAFTAEFITDSDNVIVNAAHAGGTTSKSLVDETATVTVTLLAKWFHAPLGLGQGWVNVTRSAGVNIQNTTNRSIELCYKFTANNSGFRCTYSITADGIGVLEGDYDELSDNTAKSTSTLTIPPNGVWSFTLSNTTAETYELR